MSRKLQRSEVCADCSAADPGWASINRGVLICDECCSVHRSLGRHISIVKHLRHSGWPASLLQMVQTLASNGANSIWEHSLLDPAQVQSGCRKPNPQDKVHPTKSEFIRAKYQMLAFVHKLPCRDDDGVTTKDLSKLSNRLFEELAMDVYDEVDRRENDAVWLTTQNHSTLVTERSAVPFLPVNPEYSATRNQGRQKLARFNAREFATLIIDILSDAKRRQHGKGLTSPTDNLDYSLRNHGDADDQHDYDSVASDEDTDQELLRSSNSGRNNRAKVRGENQAERGPGREPSREGTGERTEPRGGRGENGDQGRVGNGPSLRRRTEVRENWAMSMDSSDLSDGPITLQEYLEVKKALVSSESKVQQLMKVNNNLSEELRRLQREVGGATQLPMGLESAF
ncbi:UNVERIFIED_CONTAM: hypothetical protein FKN15_021807 [Acipenser sinensis]